MQVVEKHMFLEPRSLRSRAPETYTLYYRTACISSFLERNKTLGKKAFCYQEKRRSIYFRRQKILFSVAKKGFIQPKKAQPQPRFCKHVTIGSVLF